MAKNKNFGLDLSRESQSGEDWIFGANTSFIENLIVTDWSPYLLGELQNKNRLETMSCVSYTGSKNVDAIMNAHLEQVNFSEENVQWLKDKGYIVNGRFNSSDRFIAIMSGTTKYGNSGSVVCQAIRDYGLIPESTLPFTDQDTWQEYHSGVTTGMKDLGQEFKERFEIQYERVIIRKNAGTENDLVKIDTALKNSPLMVFVYAWEVPVNGVYQKTNKTINHAVALQSPEYFVNDQYINWRVDNTFVKQLASDFNLMATAYRFAVVEKNKLVSIVQKYRGKLIKNEGKAPVYFVWNDEIVWIENPDIFDFLKNKAWGDWPDILTIPEPIKGTKKFNYSDF